MGQRRFKTKNATEGKGRGMRRMPEGRATVRVAEKGEGRSVSGQGRRRRAGSCT